MKSKILNFALVLMLVLILLVLTGCAAVENTETIENESVTEEENEITEETSNLLTEEEALEIGNELYEYGSDPLTCDNETNIEYLGKSKKEIVDSETITINGAYGGYAFENASDVEDYFTEKRLSELTSDKHPSPYGLEKIDGIWYYVDPYNEGSISFLGNILTSVDSITEDEIIYTATSYYSDDFLEANWYGETGIVRSNYDTTEEYINEVESKYTCTTKTNGFVIKLEDGNWKIDQQVVVF